MLFVLFINDLPKCITSGTNIALYADDTKIWRKINSEEDQKILQRDIDSLQAWSVTNKMKFHPKKCKVLSVTICKKYHYILPFDRFAYCLDRICLDYLETKKDLGVHVTSKLNFKEHIFYLCSKANRMLGLVKRTCQFVKNPDRKRVLYLCLVSSQFNHFSPIWNPSLISLLNKIERVQIKAIKWILSEQCVTYSKNEYFIKCKSLDLLPLKLRLDLYDILLFHKIIHKTISIELPSYITLKRQTFLRSSLNDPYKFVSSIKPRIINKNTTFPKTSNKKKKIRVNTKKICKTKFKKKTCKAKNRKTSRFFKKQIKQENIYGAENDDTDDFGEDKVFVNSYLYKTHIRWNNLPQDLKKNETGKYLWS